MRTHCPILETEHLTLASISISELGQLHAFLTDPGVRRYLWDNVIISREEIAEIVAAIRQDFVNHEKAGKRFDRCSQINGLETIYYVLSGEAWAQKSAVI